MENVTFQMVIEAARELKGIIKETDFCYAETLSGLTKGEIYLKLENLQQSGSFKIRGAYNKMVHLTEKEKKSGVVASSAGNHAQGGRRILPQCLCGIARRYGSSGRRCAPGR